MSSLILSPSEARKIILHAAGLTKQAQFGKGREGVFRVIDHLGFVQIDTNYTVERAHHHTLFARVPDYKQEWLEELQEDGRIFEYFTSDAGYIPMSDFRFSLPVKESFLQNRKPQTSAENSLMNKVLDRIGREGPLMVQNFENDRVQASTGWWDWRPSKVALERLYLDGRLMITRKKDFRKVFDLPLNILPADTDKKMPTDAEFAGYVIRRVLLSLGIASVKEMAWRARRVPNNTVKKELEKLVENGEVIPVSVEGRKTGKLYMLPAYKKKKITLSGDAWFLSPFDPLNVFRHRLRDFFDFDYQIECFVPEPKRKYGYFSLPVLVGDQFVARVDSKADRKNGLLIVHHFHFEPVKPDSAMIEKIAQALKRFMAFNQCDRAEFKKTNNGSMLKKIKESL